MSEQANNQMSPVERVSEVSNVEQANECAVRSNERTDEQVTFRFLAVLNHCAATKMPPGSEIGLLRVKFVTDRPTDQ